MLYQSYRPVNGSLLDGPKPPGTTDNAFAKRVVS
jgi:hypothetical protein